MKQNMKEAIGLSLKRYNETYMKPINDRIDNIVAQAGNDNTEIVDARIDSAGVTHTTLNNRILAETKMNDEQLVEYTGSNISAEDTTQGYLKDVEILGNTIQNEEDLADIKSVGVLQEDGTYKMSILSRKEDGNLNEMTEVGILNNTTGEETASNTYIRSGFIRIKKDDSYFWGIDGVSYNMYCVIYDVNKSFVRMAGESASKSFISDIDGYMRVYRQNVSSTSNKIHVSKTQLLTPYEPYQGNKCDILLPCQLEKVGDVSDRLYYDEDEKAWCIEKNIVKVYLSTLSDWNIHSALTGNSSEYIAFSCRLPKNDFSDYNDGKAGNAICTVAPNLSVNKMHPSIVGESASEIEGVAINSIGNLFVKLLRTKADNVEKFESFITNHFVMYKITPQKIVLPLDVQIALNSFFGTTHVYMESGEVEGTIKCKIPKSLGATVQSLNNKTDILSDRIEAIEGLKDSQNMKYETDKGYLVCKETKNGTIDDLKLEGRTLVNRFDTKNINVSYPNGLNKTQGNKFGISISQGTTIVATRFEITFSETINFKDKTFAFNVLTPQVNGLQLYLYGESDIQLADYKKEACVNFTKYYTNDLLVKKIRLYVNRELSLSESDTVYMQNVMLLEGDHTQNPPSYFEGLMSVGEDVDKIEVLSSNGNLLNGISMAKNIQQIASGVLDTENKTIKFDCRNIDGKEIKTIKFDKGSYTFIFKGYNTGGTHSYSNLKIMYTDGTSNKFPDFDSQGFSKIVSDASKTISHIEGNWSSVGTLLYYDECYIIKGNRLDYEIQQDKKQILFYNENGELEPVTELREWDSIEKHSDNKWYYHKRSGEVVFDGSEDWILAQTNTNTLRFQVLNSHTKIASTLLSDRFLYENSTTNDSEHIVGHSTSNYIQILILKTRLSTQDTTGFKTWLQSNPVTIVYQLATEEVYELAPLHLDSYANETLILCNSGAISPKMEFSITSHISELVKSYGERVNFLEEKVYKYMVAQNRLQLASTYSADSVTFKVDYYAMYNNEAEEYNNDLYDLILNNILVGKDNYDYDKMFNIILDYASWNQISWEQFDILVGLMDMQHNPPVEDIIEEDIIEEETPVE